MEWLWCAALALASGPDVPSAPTPVRPKAQQSPTVVPTPSEPPPPAPDEPPPPASSEPPPAEPTQPPAEQPAVPTEPPAKPCPCDPIDWRCWQEHADVCKWDPDRRPPVPTPATPKPLPPPSAEDEAKEWTDAREDVDPEVPPWEQERPYRFEGWQRRGVLIAGGLGIVACKRLWCEGFSVGGLGGLELGYRFGILAPVFAIAGGGGPAEVSEDLRAVGWDPATSKMTFLDVGVGVLAFPLRKSRFDPYAGVRVGGSLFHRKLEHTGSLGGVGHERLKRGGVRFVVGFDVFVHPLVALGPRFELTVPFAGKLCVTGDVVGFASGRSCVPVRELESEELLDTSDLPLPFAFTLNARLVLPTRARNGS